jgi:curved DNA-binding protein
MSFIDYYKILEIDKSASDSEIKKAYRRLARKYHPDVNPNDKTAEQKFKQINEANEVLSNPENRKKYDAYGKDWKHAEEIERQRQQQQNSQQWSSGESYGGEDFSDFFSSMFGQGQRGGSRVKYKGQDFHTELHLELEDVFTAHKRTLNVNGKKIRITIPAGIHNKQTIKIAGHGGQGINGGPNGDLYIEFTIANHSRFKRDHQNLYANVDLDVFTALLGGEVVVKTLDGAVKLKVKPETQNGTKVKVKGKGFPVYKKEGQFGDLFVTYNIVLPENLTEKEKSLLHELKNLRK